MGLEANWKWMISEGGVSEKWGNLGSEKTFSRDPYTPTPAPYVTCTMLARYKDFKYTRTLHQSYTHPTPFSAFIMQKNE